VIYVFDIDGTLADLSHRLHYIQKEPKDWDGFFAACTADNPIEPVAAIARSLHAGEATIILLSGRSSIVRNQTEKWLSRHNIPYEALYMRTEGDHRHDNVVKPELMQRMLREWRGESVAAIFEDRSGVVKAFRQLGYTVFQVADGNF